MLVQEAPSICSIRSFDGLDNRRTLMDLFSRLGAGLPTDRANARRARFLQWLIKASNSGWCEKELQVSPCTAVEAYNLFLAITAQLDVPINTGARLLERWVRLG